MQPRQGRPRGLACRSSGAVLTSLLIASNPTTDTIKVTLTFNSARTNARSLQSSTRVQLIRSALLSPAGATGTLPIGLHNNTLLILREQGECTRYSLVSLSPLRRGARGSARPRRGASAGAARTAPRAALAWPPPSPAPAQPACAPPAPRRDTWPSGACRASCPCTWGCGSARRRTFLGETRHVRAACC